MKRFNKIWISQLREKLLHVNINHRSVFRTSVKRLIWSFLRKYLTAKNCLPFLLKISILDIQLGSEYTSQSNTCSFWSLTLYNQFTFQRSIRDPRQISLLILRVFWVKQLTSVLPESSENHRLCDDFGGNRGYWIRLNWPKAISKIWQRALNPIALKLDFS